MKTDWRKRWRLAFLLVLVFAYLLHGMYLAFLMHTMYVEDGHLLEAVAPKEQPRNDNDRNTVRQSRSSIVSDPDHGVPMNHPQEVTKQTFEQDPLFEKIHKQIDSEDEATRCKRYGFTHTPGTKRRRVFFGALVASDTMDVIRIHATETYDIYHTVALLESNTTFKNTPRNLRFEPGSEMYKFTTAGVFGKKTQVFVDFWLDKAPDAIFMTREQIQRESILYRWKQQGMRPDDVGVVGDIDEVFSRDFLRASQVCNIPQFQETDCLKPKIVALTNSYESSPECRKQKEWFHPDMMIGACLDGVGDPTGRIVPVRNYHRTRGKRDDASGNRGKYRDEHVSLGRYPLWSIQDVRSQGGSSGQQTWADVRWGVAYHFHNFFEDVSTVRNKYVTYGHGDLTAASAATLPLSEITGDLDLVVRCVHDLSNSANPEMSARVETPFYEIEGPNPIYFSNETYRRVRHEHVRKIVLADEKQFGYFYNDSSKVLTL